MNGIFLGRGYPGDNGGCAVLHLLKSVDMAGSRPMVRPLAHTLSNPMAGLAHPTREGGSA